MSGLLRLRWMCLLALVCTMVACGGDDTGEGEDLPAPISEEVNAEEGAEIETQGVSINIPGGALTDDTEVTLEVILPTGQPDADKLGSLIYDFGPDGTEFEVPVELTIDLNKALPEGMGAQMAWLDEKTDKWVPLEDSEVDGMTVTATTTHFTMFAIVLTADGQIAGGCADLSEDFEPCGGDLEGTWEFTLGCFDLGFDVNSEDSPFGECPDLVVDINVDVGGTVTFEGSDYDLALTRSAEVNFRIPTSCLPMGANCADVAGDDENASAELDGDICVLTNTEPESSETEMGTFELQDDTLIFMDSESTEADEPQEFCVEGNTVTVRNVEIDEETGEEQVIFFQATRQ